MPESQSSTSPQPQGTAALSRNVRVLGWSSLFNDVASEAMVPLLPTFLLSLGGTSFDLGILEGLADAIASLVKIVSGMRSDRTGRRKGMIVLGYLLTITIRPLIGLATVLWQVKALRAADRFGKGIRTAPRDALIADSTPPELRGRAFGFHRAMDHLGAAIGPILASVYLWYRPGDLRGLFLWTIVPGLGVLAMQLFGLKEPPKKPVEQSSPKEGVAAVLTPPLMDRRFLGYLAALTVFTLANASDLFLIQRAQELGVPLVQIPLLWCVFHVVKSAGNRWSGILVDRFDARRWLITGWTIYAIVYGAFAFATRPIHVWLLFLLYAAFYAFTEPAEKLFVSQITGGRRAGAAFGWFHVVLGVAVLPANLLFGALYKNYNPATAFACGAALSLAAAGLLCGRGRWQPADKDVSNTAV